MPALWKMCWDGDLPGVQAAVWRGEDVNTLGKAEATVTVRQAGQNKRMASDISCLMCAVWGKHYDVIEFLIKQPGLDVNWANVGGATALYSAVQLGHCRAIRMIVSHPRFNSVNTKNVDGWTPLKMAVREGHVECINELLAVEDVDLDTGDIWGESVEELAR